MKGSAKILKGRLEEAAGALSNNDNLRAKGQTDQAVGRVTQAGERGVRQARDDARKLVDKAKYDAKEAVDKANRG